MHANVSLMPVWLTVSMLQERAARDNVGRTPYGVYALVQLDAASARESLVLSVPVGGVAYLHHVVRPPQQTPAQ